jgi:hypothetical protein
MRITLSSVNGGLLTEFSSGKLSTLAAWSAPTRLTRSNSMLKGLPRTLTVGNYCRPTLFREGETGSSKTLASSLESVSARNDKLGTHVRQLFIICHRNPLACYCDLCFLDHKSCSSGPADPRPRKRNIHRHEWDDRVQALIHYALGILPLFETRIST